MSDPTIITDIVTDANTYYVNWTILLSVLAFCVTAFGTLVTILRRKLKPEEQAGKSPFCLQHKENYKRVEETAKNNSEKIEKNKEVDVKKFDELKQLVNDTSKEIEVLKVQSKNATKGMDEMKQDVKEVASKLDDLLKQLLDWTD